MLPRCFIRYLVAAAALLLAATSCSSPATTTVVVTPTTNKGLCTLVAPSVVATVLSESMTYPTTLAHGSTTECVYRSKQGAGTAVLIRYDTHSSISIFAKSKAAFERRGQKVGVVTGLGDQAYYFSEGTRQVGVTTVVLVKGSLQLLATGPVTLDQIGSNRTLHVEPIRGHARITSVIELRHLPRSLLNEARSDRKVPGRSRQWSVATFADANGFIAGSSGPLPGSVRPWSPWLDVGGPARTLRTRPRRRRRGGAGPMELRE